MFYNIGPRAKYNKVFIRNLRILVMSLSFLSLAIFSRLVLQTLQLIPNINKLRTLKLYNICPWWQNLAVISHHEVILSAFFVNRY